MRGAFHCEPFTVNRVEKVLQRGEQIDIMVDKAEDLESEVSVCFPLVLEPPDAQGSPLGQEVSDIISQAQE
jgi:hypothetical protein